MPHTLFAVHPSLNLDACHSSCVLLLRDAIMGNAGTQGICGMRRTWRHPCALPTHLHATPVVSRAKELSQEPKNSLKSPNTSPSIHRWNLLELSHYPKIPFLPMEGPYKHKLSLVVDTLMVIESVLLSFSWLSRSHRATAALWIAAFTLPKPPEIVLQVF